MLNKIKLIVVTAALMALPLTASAVPLDEGIFGVNEVIAGESYSYTEEVAVGAGSGNRVFNLTATPPATPTLDGRVSTLEFTGLFENLAVFVNGVEVLGQNGIDSRVFAFETLFNAANGFTQSLLISFTDVLEGPATNSSVATLNVQLSAVPVPAAGLLLLSALGGAAALRRRKTPAA